jgi:hypothetical protein
VRRAPRSRRAADAQQTPFEQAFALVLTGGFLYRYDCIEVASTSKGCHDVYRLHKDNLPASAEVDIDQTLYCINVPDGWMDTQRALLTSHAFVKTVFDKVHRIRVQQHLTKKARTEAEAALPLWGVDVSDGMVIVSLYSQIWIVLGPRRGLLDARCWEYQLTLDDSGQPVWP